MSRERRGKWLLAFLAICMPGLATAAMPSARIKAIKLGGFRLGMTTAEAEAVIRARGDFNEVRAEIRPSFDCDDLYPASRRDTYDPYKSPKIISKYLSGDRLGFLYRADLTAVPSGATVSFIAYRERRGIGTWRKYLAEAEARYGKADNVRKDANGELEASWCIPGETDCGSGYNHGPKLSLTYLPHSRGEIASRDILDFAVDEGRAAGDRRERFYNMLALQRPAAARALYQQCRTPTGKYADRIQSDHHMASLVSFGPGVAPPIWAASAVPSPVFAALGIDAHKVFGPGVCFNSMDFPIKLPGCKTYTSVDFRWARRMGDMWLVSLNFGGDSVRGEYFAVAPTATGRFHKIWWSDSMTGFTAWRAKGFVPVKEDPHH